MATLRGELSLPVVNPDVVVVVVCMQTGMTALISYFYATCASSQKWCVSNGVGKAAC